jgi:hypothetical protein
VEFIDARSSHKNTLGDPFPDALRALGDSTVHEDPNELFIGGEIKIYVDDLPFSKETSCPT